MIHSRTIASLLLSFFLIGCVTETYSPEFTSKDLIGTFRGDFRGKTTFENGTVNLLNDVGSVTFYESRDGHVYFSEVSDSCKVPSTTVGKTILIWTTTCSYETDGNNCTITIDGSGEILAKNPTEIIVSIYRSFSCTNSIGAQSRGVTEITFSGSEI